MKLWGSGETPDESVERFTAGDDPDLDLRLLPYDCLASAAHAAMLHAIGVLTADELGDIESGLEEILALHRRGEFVIRPEDEDVHTAIENHLTARFGDAGRKIHTGRSRNDQVLTALRLYEKEAAQHILTAVERYREALADLTRRAGECPLPGYTHTRRAMPTSVATWAGAFSDLARDDAEYLRAALHVLDQNPLGTAAGFGVPVLRLDRELTTSRLGFSRVLANPMAAQLGRGKVEAGLLWACAQVLLGLNRLATDLILFSTTEFGFVRLAPELTTGSSIMPQKRNPDVLEIVRASYHVVAGEEAKLRGIAAGLTSGYHRDLQCTKKPLFEGLDVTRRALSILPVVLAGIELDEARCRAALTEDLYATERVYERVARGVPFRDAYRDEARRCRTGASGPDEDD